MLPHVRRLARLDLGNPIHVQRAVDGHQGVVLERYQHAGVDGLLVVDGVLGAGDDLEHQAGVAQNLSPLGTIARGEGGVKLGDQGVGVLEAVGALHEARVIDQVLAAQALDQNRPIAILVEDGEHDPLVVAATVVSRQGVEVLIAWRPGVEGCATQRRLHLKTMGPKTIGEQRRTHLRAFAGALTLIQPQHDGAEQRDRRGVVAHAGERARRRCACIRAAAVHQARARPVGRQIEAGFGHFGPSLTVTGE